ncbi:hypothetical protein [Streptomyces sp. NPDC008001]|uniref:hypothetical protein n=1 Tax=Streptomyces sp. NPDC008001 TaxID=3364804 RepID=UPI0036E1B434
MKRLAGLACAAAAVLACGVATAAAHSDHEEAQGFASTPRLAPQEARHAAKMGGFLHVFGEPVEVRPGANAPAVAVCPVGHVPVGGGGETSAHRIYFTDSFAQGPQWVTRGTNTSDGSESMRAFVVCAARG